MFTALYFVLGTLLSILDPGGVDWIALAERIDPVEQTGPTAASVQLDLLPDPDSAARLADDLRARFADDPLGRDVFVDVVPGDAELPPSYRVGVGPFPSYAAAELARAQLEDAGFASFVRSADPSLGC